MTRSTSPVAVCCCSASLTSAVRACTSSNRRTFSMAITAWSAKVSTNSICFLVKGFTTGARQHENADRNSLLAAAARPAPCGIPHVAGFRALHTPRPPARPRCGRSSPPAPRARRRCPRPGDGDCLRILLETSAKPKLAARRKEAVLLALEDLALVGIADASGRLDQRVEHGLESKAEALITLSTSAVAVCCCSASGVPQFALVPPRTVARFRWRSRPGRRRFSS